jgi:outer membrane protein assembly factor BamB
MNTRILFVCIFFLLSSQVHAQHSSQWRGPERNGHYHETGLLKVWPEEGPELLWYSEDIGNGHSSASVSESGIYISGRIDSLEYLSYFNLEGQLQWQVPFGRRWQGSFPDSRSTPNVIDNKVYVVSGMGEVVCLDAKKGDILWKMDAWKEFAGACTMWGFCESPLVVDDKLIFTPGGMQTSMVALNRENGEVVWTSESMQDSVGYVSPVAFDHQGRKIISSIGANYFFGIDAESGELLWHFDYKVLSHFDHPYAPIINVNTPLYYKNEIYISKGYDHEGVKFSLSQKGNEVEKLWSDTVLDIHLGGMVLHKGYLYGSNWIHNRDGNWCCLNWESGEVQYETHWKNKGSIITADGLLYCYEEKGGFMALVDPDPEEFRIISSFKTSHGSGPAWAHPVISNGVLYVRRGKALMAYDIGS